MRSLWLLGFIALCTYVVASSLDNRHSATPPYGIPYWTIGGDAFATEGFIRLAEDRQSRKGWFWNTIPSQLSEWQVTYRFRIHGVSSVGADGIAFWYTEDSHITGDLFGNQNNFKGIGVVLDTYDNDGSGKHPYLSIIQNDGGDFKHHHDHESDERKDVGGTVNGCTVNVRGLRSPSAIRVSYSRGFLQVSTDLEDTGTFTNCASRQITLPSGYFFGFSAATGHLADNHDIYSLEVQDLARGIPMSNNLDETLFSAILAGLQRRVRALGGSQSAAGGASSPNREKHLQTINQISSQLERLQADLKKAPSGSDRAPTPRGGGSGEDPCPAVSNSIHALQRNIEKLDREANKKFGESKQVFNQITREISAGEVFDVFGLLQLLVLIALIIFAVVVYLIYDDDKKRRLF
jgi:hypothetical protein